MARFSLIDNTSYTTEKHPIPEGFLNSRIYKELRNTTLDSLCDKGVIIFPLKETAKASEKKTFFDDASDSGFRTTNLMGFLSTSDGKETLVMNSRFAEKDSSAYFLHYMLERVFHFNVFTCPNAYSDRDAIHDLMMLAFPYVLHEACRQGLYRTYVRRQMNDSRVRGTIDIARHIRLNTPFAGDIAYTVRDFDVDNPVNELIRHTIEYIRQHPLAGILESSAIDDVTHIRRHVNDLHQSTPRYRLQDRRNIIAWNATHPLRHPLYTGYQDLQRLCLDILTHHRISIGEGKRNHIYGLVFDGSWLWEEYVATLLRERFFHPNNTTNYGTQHLFEDGNDIVYPDFILRDGNPRIIADAKYKRAPRFSSGKSHINRNDRFQILAYMLRFDAPHGVFIHPLTDDITTRKDYTLASGVNLYGERGESDTSSHTRQVHIRGIVIPQQPSDAGEWTYANFNKAIADNEQSFLKSIRFHS